MEITIVPVALLPINVKTVMVFGVHKQIAQGAIKKQIILLSMYVLGAEVTTQQTIRIRHPQALVNSAPGHQETQ